ncbi:hypothetical protein [Anaerocolumna sp.]|uniref:hypothetical protein n=1 Tax=Anaerocolumna sp. TaxID=2041569 RepID=UPI0028B2237C|nr:hypothetical protein [Anaerocolumna sp.]
MKDIDYEKLRDYKAGTYKTMSLKEKMDFLNGVHREEVEIFDEEGKDMDTLQDFWDIEDDFLNNPQQFSLNDILSFINMLDDWCFELSWMEQVVDIIVNIACFYRINGIVFLLSNLKNVPEKGRLFGQFRVMQRLLAENIYPTVKEAVKQINPSDRMLVLYILEGEPAPPKPTKKGERKHLPKVAGENASDILKQENAELVSIISNYYH